MSGYVKVYRSLTEHWLADQPTKLGWWILLLLKASHKDIQVSTGAQIIDLKRGQIAASLSYLANLWKTSKTTAERFLDMLEKNGMVERCTERKLTIITICNYGVYQGKDDRIWGDNRDDRRDDDGTMTGRKQECKECKEEKFDINTNAHTHTPTREDRVPWDATRERRFYNTFRGSGVASPLASATGKNAKEILNLLEVFMAECEVRGRGHQDFQDFKDHLLNSIKGKYLSMPNQQNQERNVISGRAIFDVYGKQ